MPVEKVTQATIHVNIFFFFNFSDLPSAARITRNHMITKAKRLTFYIWNDKRDNKQKKKKRKKQIKTRRREKKNYSKRAIKFQERVSVSRQNLLCRFLEWPYYKIKGCQIVIFIVKFLTFKNVESLSSVITNKIKINLCLVLIEILYYL